MTALNFVSVSLRIATKSASVEFEGRPEVFARKNFRSVSGITNQSKETSETGTGIYLRASIGIILARSLSFLVGSVMTVIRLAESGMATPPVRQVMFAS